MRRPYVTWTTRVGRRSRRRAKLESWAQQSLIPNWGFAPTTECSNSQDRTDETERSIGPNSWNIDTPTADALND